MTALTLTRSDPTKNLHRYYRLDVQPDLFGAWCFIREWGRIGHRGGQSRPRPEFRGPRVRARVRRLENRRGNRSICRHRPSASPFRGLSAAQPAGSITSSVRQPNPVRFHNILARLQSEEQSEERAKPCTTPIIISGQVL
jgi:predicted DNA-binding WGR domain protein